MESSPPTAIVVEPHSRRRIWPWLVAGAFGGLASFVLGLVVGYGQGADLEERAILPPFRFDDFGTYVFASGTWVMVEDRQAFPVQTTRIACMKDWAMCLESTATISDAGGFGPHLGVNTEYHDVERWTDAEIRTRPSETSCVSYVLTIDRRNEQVTAVRAPMNATSGFCRGIDLRTLNLRLLDGAEALERHRTLRPD